MAEFGAKSLAILGRQPALGTAELESLYGALHIRRLPNAALIDLDVNDIDFKRLGGTVKLAKVLNILPTQKWAELETYLASSIPVHLKYVPKGKFTLGLSAYGFEVSTQTINSSLLQLKKIIRESGRSARVVPNKQPALSSAQVLHNKLTSKGAWELLFVKNGSHTLLAQTMFVQDIESYAARDQARPKRDMHVGMLPPKLAQIIINLATPPPGGLVLDPFAGTGVVLQEALLMGFRAIGTDIDERMVDFSRQNIEWLGRQKAGLRAAEIFQADATVDQWTKEIDAVASEVYLGPPLKSEPPAQELSSEIGSLLKAFLQNISPQLAKGVKLSLAIPAWPKSASQSFITPDIGKLTDVGYNHIKFQQATDGELIYWRQGQLVGRQLIVLQKV